MAVIFLTHMPEMLATYDGERATAARLHRPRSYASPLLKKLSALAIVPDEVG